MFAKSKSSGSTPSVILPNPLQNLYEVGKQSATAGPENAWRIYDGYTKTDRKVIQFFNDQHPSSSPPSFFPPPPIVVRLLAPFSFVLGSVDIFLRQKIGR